MMDNLGTMMDIVDKKNLTNANKYFIGYLQDFFYSCVKTKL